MDIKRILTMKTHLTLSIIIYTVYYLLKTFVLWEFTHPFQWVLDLPSMDFSDRLIILTILITFHGSIFVATLPYRK